MNLSDKQIEILNIAENLFAKKGINATSIRQIAQKAKINVAMVSYYFGSKDRMVEILFQYKLQSFQEVLKKIAGNSVKSTKELLIEFIQLYIESLHKNPNFHKIMMREFSLGEVSTEIALKVTQMKIQNIQLINQILKNGYEKKEFRHLVEGEFLLGIVLGSSSYFIMNQNMYLNYWKCNNQNDYLQILLRYHLPNVIKSLEAILHFNNNEN